MAPQQRRDTIVRAALPLVLEHGRAVTTKQIADAAGIAEGTVFRAFDTKDDLVDAVVAAAFDMEPYIEAVERLDGSGSLDDVLTRLAQLQIDRFAHVFRLLSVLGVQGPPKHEVHADWLERIAQAHRGLLARHTDELRLTPREVMRYVRLLAFSGSNPHITDGRTLTAAEIVSLVLDGARREGPPCSGD
jgi:AcrR family transcriptional regulator